MSCAGSIRWETNGAGRREYRVEASLPGGSSRTETPPVDFPAAQQRQNLSVHRSLDEIAREAAFGFRKHPPARNRSRAWSCSGLRVRAWSARAPPGPARRLHLKRATEQSSHFRSVSSLAPRGRGRAAKARKRGADQGRTGNRQCGRIRFRSRGTDGSVLRSGAEPLLQRVEDQRRRAPFWEDVHHRDLAGRQSGQVGQCFGCVFRKCAKQGFKVRPECGWGRRLLEHLDDLGPARWAERGEQQRFLRTEPMQQCRCADSHYRRDFSQGDGPAVCQDRGARCPENLLIAHLLWPTHGVGTSSASRVEVCKSQEMDSLAAVPP